MPSRSPEEAARLGPVLFLYVYFKCLASVQIQSHSFPLIFRIPLTPNLLFFRGTWMKTLAKSVPNFLELTKHLVAKWNGTHLLPQHSGGWTAGLSV